MAFDSNVVSNQQSFIDKPIDQWRDCFNACLKDTFNRFEVEHVFLCNRHCFILQGRVRTAEEE